MESVLLQMHSFYTAETTQIKIMLTPEIVSTATNAVSCKTKVESYEIVWEQIMSTHCDCVKVEANSTFLRCCALTLSPG